MSGPAASLKPAAEGTPVPDEFKQKTKKPDSLTATAKTDWLSGATFSFRIANVEPLGNGRAKLNLELHCSPTDRNRFTTALIQCSFEPALIMDFQPRSLESLPPPGHRGKQVFSDATTLEPDVGAFDVNVKLGSKTSSTTGESDGSFGLTGSLLDDSTCRWSLQENAFSKKRGIANFHTFWVEVSDDKFFSINTDIVAETSGMRAGNLKVKETWQFWKEGDESYNFLQASTRKAK